MAVKLDTAEAEELRRKAGRILRRKDTESVGMGHYLVTIQQEPLVRIRVRPGEEIDNIVEALIERREQQGQQQPQQATA